MVGTVKLAPTIDQSIPTERTALLSQQDDTIIISGPGRAIKGIDEDEEGDLENGSQHEIVEDGGSSITLVRVLSVLMIGSFTTFDLLCQTSTKSNAGIFVAQIDGSILMATYPVIASEFDDLKNATWLVTSFALAGAATQTLVRD